MLTGSYIFFIALLLGLKHALEPDHLIAISTIVYKHKNPIKAAYNGLLWGLGHTFTIFLIGLLVLSYKLSISDNIALWLERGVAIMIVFLGIKTLSQYKKVNSHEHGEHTHTHHHEDHSHHHENSLIEKLKPFIVGTIQGLAGSAGLIILTMSTANTTFQGIIFILLFGIGTIISMFFYTYCISYSINKVNNNNFQIKLNLIVGVLSTIFGIYYITII